MKIGNESDSLVSHEFGGRTRSRLDFEETFLMDLPGKNCEG